MAAGLAVAEQANDIGGFIARAERTAPCGGPTFFQANRPTPINIRDRLAVTSPTRRTIARRPWLRLNGPMTPRFLTILTRCDLLVIRQTRQPGPSIINEKTIADFVRVVERAD